VKGVLIHHQPIVIEQWQINANGYDSHPGARDLTILLTDEKLHYGCTTPQNSETPGLGTFEKLFEARTKSTAHDTRQSARCGVTSLRKVSAMRDYLSTLDVSGRYLADIHH
jgi:hypothetical protein